MHETSNRFTKVVLPEPDGAVITMIFPLLKFKNYMRIKQKKTAYANNESIKKEVASHLSNICIFLHCLAIGFKCLYQVCGYHLRRAAFNVVALYHMHHFAVFQQGYGR